MKRWLYQCLDKTLLYPVRVQNCSQTLYEALVGCLRMTKATGDAVWRKRADTVCQRLIDIQQPDGGFDIGYDFNFGRLHSKGESTSPELRGLLALMLYYEVDPRKDVANAAQRAASWIEQHAYPIDTARWTIPYAPYSTREVMVYNGVSFVASALGLYLSAFPNDRLRECYEGMVRYLLDVLIVPNEGSGYWPYADRTRTDLSAEQRGKIDNYHQMQQVEVHAIAQVRTPLDEQEVLIRKASAYVRSLMDANGLVPYYNNCRESPIHVWGYASCVSGFLLASESIPSRRADYRAAAEQVVRWLLDHAWNGAFFWPILGREGIPLDRRYYVRSDAWVFNALALAMQNGLDVEASVMEATYTRMEEQDFSGIENHATSPRIRFVRAALNGAGGILKSKAKATSA